MTSKKEFGPMARWVIYLVLVSAMAAGMALPWVLVAYVKGWI